MFNPFEDNLFNPLGSFAFEMFGRRKTSIVGGLVVILGTFFGLFCQSYGFMVVIRLMQGFGNFLAYSGCYIWILELVSENMRVYYNFWSMMLWALGKGQVQSRTSVNHLNLFPKPVC